MKSVAMRGTVMAAVASIFVFGYGVTAPVHAQQTAALAANPELAAKGVWDPAIRYVTDDIVTARGSTWIAKRNNRNRVPGQTQPSTADDWELFARGFNPTGAWVNTTKYQPDDLVTRLGQTYRAKLTNTNRLPTNTTYWELLAAKGADGAAGPQGPAGPNTGIGDGSASAPSISFSGDPNTGIFHPAEDKIALVEGGQLFLHNAGANNTALGLNALSSLSTGTGNTALGQQALNANQAGQDNTAIGNYALTSNSTGVDNTAVGANALIGNTVGNNNTAVGKSALAFNTNGTQNTAVGRDALASNVNGVQNTAVGYQALAANTTGGHFNTAVGRFALGSNTNGSANTALGTGALAANTTGSNNVAIGDGAGSNNSTGGNNIAIGPSALFANTTAGSNIAIGNLALSSNQTASDNTAVGWSALMSNTGGQFNVAIGNEALGSSSTGSSNIAIGAAAGYFATAPASSIFIGNSGLIADTATIKIGTQGTQTTAFMAGITGVNVDNEAAVAINTATGQLGVVASSRRYKEDIAPMGDVNGVLMKLRPVTFHYKGASDDGRRALQYGLIAEEVAESVPDLAAYNAQGTPETVKYHLLPSFLLAGYQAQQKTIGAQAEKIEALEARLARLEAALSRTSAASLRQ